MNLIVEPHGGEFKPCNIFIVEDEALIAMEIKDRLLHFGYQVCGVAARGEVALKQIVDLKPDLVLMDINLAGEIDGIETASQLAEINDTPVIFLTAYSDDGLIRKAMDTGPFGYLVKPFEGRELHATIQMALYKHRMEQALQAANDQLEARAAALTESERFIRATVDAIGAHLAVLESDGRIVTVNAAWRRFAAENDLDWQALYENANYLDVCDKTTGDCAEDAHAIAAGIRDVIAGRSAEFMREYPCHSPDEERWFICRVVPFQSGRSMRVVVTHDNVTAVHQALEKVAAGERRLAALAEERTAAVTEAADRLREAQRLAQVGSSENDLVNGGRIWSDEMYNIFGIDKESAGLSLKNILAIIHPDDRDEVNKIYASAIASGGSYQTEFRLKMPDGRIKWVEGRGQVEPDAAGKPLRLVSTVQDITERVEFTQALNQSRERLKEAQRMARVGSWEIDLEKGTRTWSDEMNNIFGFEPGKADVRLESLMAVIHPEDRGKFNKEYELSLVSGGAYQAVHRLKMPDGSLKWTEERGQSEYDASGKPIRSFGTMQDITERKRIELAMTTLSTDLIELEGEAYFETAAVRLTEFLGVDVVIINRFNPVNLDEFQTITYLLDGKVMPNFGYSVAGTPAAQMAKGHALAIESGAWKEYPEAPFLVEKVIEGYAAEPLFDHAGRVLGHLAVMSRRPLVDPETIKTTLKMFAVALAAEIVQERHKRQYEDLFEFAPSGMIMTDQKGRIALVNREAEQMFGWTRAEMLGQPVEMLVAPELRNAHHGIREAFHKNASRRQMGADRPALRGYRKDGSDFPAEIDLAPVESENGIMVAAAVRDITARKMLEAKLGEAMKMDAIGKLTGGMAHDFNNYLGVIIGNLDLLKEHEVNDPAASKLVDAALGGALKGADLTQSLLAFSRRQPLDSRLTDVNQNIEMVISLLQRTLGGNVTLTAKLEPDLWPVKIDAAQFDSCIINLTNNASFAMPDGGSLVILTRNAHLDEAYVEGNLEAAPGDYVLIEISDTGVGMSPETAARVFEPFFTTKGVGHGTGLGLSMVYGFVKQSGGHIKIYSEIGHGTTVRVYLPRDAAGASLAPSPEAALPSTIAHSGGAETILVVEDNELVRRTVLKQLGSLGYNVIEAENGEAGLAILKKAGMSIDLLFTDVVMPGNLDGFELAKIALEMRSGIKILLTSGFPGDTLNYIGKHAAYMSLLGKPYRKNDLAQEVRRILDAAV